MPGARCPRSGRVPNKTKHEPSHLSLSGNLIRLAVDRESGDAVVYEGLFLGSLVGRLSKRTRRDRFRIPIRR